MGFFIREKNDGRRAPGYALYLAGVAAAAAAVFGLRRGAPRRAAPAPRPAPSHLAPITEPAAAITAIDVKAAGRSGPPSYRLPAPPRPAAGKQPVEPPDSFDAISAALDEDGSPASIPSAAPAGEGFARLPPAFAPGPARAANNDLPAGYRDPAADAAEQPDRPEADAPSRAPRGSLISVCLLTSVDTGNPAALVQFAATRDFCFGRRRLIPFGARFLGKLAGAAGRDRLNLTADTLLLRDGTEIPLQASAVEATDDDLDVRPGVAAAYHPPPALAQAAPYLAEAVGGTLGLLVARAQPLAPLGLGGLQAEGGGGDLRIPAYQASSQAVQDYAANRLKEFEHRHAGYYLVPAGTACRLQLEADLEVIIRHASSDSHPPAR